MRTPLETKLLGVLREIACGTKVWEREEMIDAAMEALMDAEYDFEVKKPPYGEWCRESANPNSECRKRGYCPRDSNCGD